MRRSHIIHHWLGLWLGALAVLALGYRELTAQDPASESRQDSSARHLQEMKRHAVQYEITLSTEPPRRLQLREEPVLRWTNPLRITNDGAVFLWLADGRPEAIASFYQFQRDGMQAEDHEFQSLATTGLIASRDGKDVWVPKEPGIRLKLLPDAPPVASSPAERSRQMRALAREFRAYLDRPNNKSELRLLSQPLFRYDASRPELVDGALFAFVLATDPEVLLLFEARPHLGKPAWHYAIARMSMMELRVERNEQTIWEVPFNSEANSRHRPYLITPAPPLSAGECSPNQGGR